MLPVDSFFTLAVLSYLLLVMYVANQADSGGAPGKPIALILMQSLIVLIVLFAPYMLLAIYATAQPNEAGLPPIDPGAGVLVAAMAVVAAILGYQALHSPAFQAALARRMPGYQPESLVHQTAVLLCLMMLTFNALQFVSIGGLGGVADSIESAGIDVRSVLFECTLWVVAALLGVGFAIRRTLDQTLDRLGLRPPTLNDVVVGTAAGFGLFLLGIVFQVVWAALAPQMMEEQTVAAEAMSALINNLPLALLVAACAALGEEIIMRGALQPVFGVWLTSIFFVSLHSQYLFTPIMLLIFAVSMGLGYLRQRYSTTTAIVAHFAYNAIPFLLVGMGGAA